MTLPTPPDPAEDATPGRYLVPTPLDGYRALNDREVALAARLKRLEADVGRLWRDLRAAHRDTVGRADDPTFDVQRDAVYVDARWHALARTQLQQGFSTLLRSVTRPRDVFDTADTDEP